jgi:hypothetical protein
LENTPGLGFRKKKGVGLENTPGVGFRRKKQRDLVNTPELDAENTPGVGFKKYTMSGIYKIQQKCIWKIHQEWD